MLGFSPISTAPICAHMPAVGAGEPEVADTFAITDWSGPTFVGIEGDAPEPDMLAVTCWSGPTMIGIEASDGAPVDEDGPFLSTMSRAQ